MDLVDDVAARSGEWLKPPVSYRKVFPSYPPVLSPPLLVHPQFIY